MPANRTKLDAALAVLVLLAAGVVVALLAAPVRAQNGALLSIPNLSIPAGQAKVVVPVNFDPGEEAVAAIIFSLDLETTCLRLPLTDANSDGRPDAVEILTSDAFQASVAYSAIDPTGEIDFSIADWSIPFSVIPSGTIVKLTLDVLCAPDPTQATRVVPLAFSNAPQPSFGDIEGESAPGTWESGTLTIVNPATATPTDVPPTATNTPVTPPPTATNTPVTPPPTATNTPIGGPTATNTPVVTPPTATHTPVPPPPTATNTPVPPPGCEDGDGVGNEPPGDADGDGKPNCRDDDDDGDAIPTLIEDDGDPDRDGIPSYLDSDSNNNGIPDAVEVGPDPLHPVDADHNGTFDFLQMPAIFLPLVHR